MALPHSLRVLDYPARFQFGSPSAPCSGSSCCTDTCIKMIIEYYKEISPTLSEIRRAAQRNTNFDEHACTGLNAVEVINALRYYGIDHYRIGAGVTGAVVWDKVKTGPVLVGVHYGSYPNKDGKCGDRNVAERNGRTDCPFSGAHAVLAVGGRRHIINGKLRHRDFFVRDPDHNSSSRPEKPNYDIVRKAQLDRAMAALAPNTAFHSSYIIYPTKMKTLSHGR